MTTRGKQGVTWVAVVTLMIGILGFALTYVFAGKPELEEISGRVTALEQHRVEDKADIRELKADVKEVLKRLPEKR